jgi:ABC-type polysaccharide/polyol phosphate export permease
MALVAAVVSARYRDIPLMVQDILTILFWFTPPMYFPGPIRIFEGSPKLSDILLH